MIWKRKVKKLSVIFGIILVMGVITYAIVSSSMQSAFVVEEIGKKKPESILLPKSSQNILAEGLCFAKFFEDKKLFSISLDSVKVIRKKVGFLSLGFLKIAKMENVCIDFYDYTENDKIDKVVGSSTRGEGFPIDFEKVLAGCKDLKLLKRKRITGIEIDKVKVCVYRDGSLVTTLMSDEAKVDSRNKEVVFEGNVKMTSGKDKEIECEEMSWFQDRERFIISGAYIAKVKNKTIKGKDMETDYLLEEMNHDFSLDKQSLKKT